jgi:hypothetical protein
MIKIKKPSAEIKIKNLINYLTIYCRNGKSTTIFRHMSSYVQIIFFKFFK